MYKNNRERFTYLFFHQKGKAGKEEKSRGEEEEKRRGEEEEGEGKGLVEGGR